jgi:hypothetical protein
VCLVHSGLINPQVAELPDIVIDADWQANGHFRLVWDGDETIVPPL